MSGRRLPILTLCLALALLDVACGSGKSSAPASPTPSPTPAPAPAFINMAGTWSGTLQLPDAQPRNVSMLIVQTIDCVDGAFHTDANEWVGAISGYATRESFSGVLSLQKADDGLGKCSGAGALEASLSGDVLTLRASNVNGECPRGLPQSLTITVRRQ